MKAVLLLVLFVAVASASILPGLGDKVDAKNTVQFPVTCQSAIYLCAAVNGSCDTDVIAGVYVNYECPRGTYELREGLFQRCRCAPLVQVNSVLGASCTPGDIPSNYGHVCASNPMALPTPDSTYHWYSQKTQGDSCSSVYDCLPPRRCIGGQCAALLSVGDVCVNYTSGSFWDRSSYCPVTAWCNITQVPGTFDSLGRCQPKLAEGELCTEDDQCPFSTQGFMSCSINPGTTETRCLVNKYYWIPTGQRSNSTFSGLSCQSGIVDSNGLCADYDTLRNTFRTTEEGRACTDTANCTIGSCTCFLGAATCQWYRSTPSSLASSESTRLSRYRAYYGQGCEYNPFRFASFDSGNCIARAGYYTTPPQGYYCGALHTMAVSSVTIALLALFSSFMSKLF
jgi:hypothetical protein